MLFIKLKLTVKYLKNLKFLLDRACMKIIVSTPQIQALRLDSAMYFQQEDPNPQP